MNSDISEKLNAVLADPEKLAQVMAIVNAFRGENVTGTSSDVQAAATAPAAAEDSTADSASPQGEDEGGAQPASSPPLSLPAMASNHHSLKGDKRVGLLLALKPYLSADRAEKVEKIIRIMEIGEMAGQFKNFL